MGWSQRFSALGGAEAAGAVDAAHPGDADACADGEFRSVAADSADLADDLVAGDDGGRERRQIALDDVQVGAADSAGDDAEQDVAGKDSGRRDVFDAEEVAGSGEVGMEDGSSHGERLVWRWNERQMRDCRCTAGRSTEESRRRGMPVLQAAHVLRHVKIPIRIKPRAAFRVVLFLM